MTAKEKIRPTLIFMSLAACLSQGAILDCDWPQAYHDLEHTACSNATSNLSFEGLELRCIYETNGRATAPVAADINSDNRSEIIFGSGDGTLYVIDKDCTRVWSYDAGGAVSKPGVFDLQNDSILTILFGSEDGMVYALDAYGNEAWTYETNGSIKASPIAAALDYSNGLEVAVASGDGRLYIFDNKGREIKSFDLYSPISSTPAIGDIDSDGGPDILVGTETRGLKIFDYRGLRRWDFPAGEVSTPLVADVNGYGNPEIFIGSGDGRLYYLFYSEYQDGSSRKCDRNGNCTLEPIMSSSIVSGWNIETGDGIVAAPIAVDFENDTKKEILAGSLDRTLYIMNSSGKVRKKHSVNGKVSSGAAAADLDGDLKPEIVFGSEDGIVHILNSSGFRRWSYDTGGAIKEPPALADLERDGKLEIIFASANRIYVFGNEPDEVPTTTTSSTSTSTSSSTTSSSSSSSSTTTTSTSSTTSTVIFHAEAISLNTSGFLLYMTGFLLLCAVVYAACDLAHDRFIVPRKEAGRYKKDLASIQKSHREKPGK
ncbi:MAG: PQQ-binding-like beta-propeller repeat protein [Candidatus Altiarchaeota archaeon]|nr:PQQ-binding-like beta-propeller repeat protein [Candidatus Altiarchaeota archaeon]